VLAPREQRRVEWRIDARSRTVLVKALDAAGTPVAGATISLHEAAPRLTEMEWDGPSNSETAGESGEVRFTEVFAPRVSVQAERQGFGTAWLSDRAVPLEGASFELRLVPGRAVDIDVVDANGFPRDVSRIALDGAPRPVLAQHLELGHYRLGDAPPGPITLRADLAGRTYRVAHDGSSPRALIEIQALGALIARWTLPLATDQNYTLLVRGTGSDDWSTTAWISDERRDSGGPVTVADIVPGDYEVVLRRGPGWTGDNPPVSQVARVTVQAGEVAEVVLEP
jgi:hypothetical protein